MRFLPIIQRELLSGARNRATYWTRCAVGLVGVLICMQSMSAAPPGTPATLGRYVFNAVVAAAFLVSCSICLLSADAISAERREGTLELIFLTGVRPVDVLLGKLGSVGLTSVCALVAFLPALVVPLRAGGVTGGEAFRKGLVLLDLLFFALVAGLCTSAAQRERFQASRRAVMIVGLVVIIPFLVFTVATHTLPRYLSLLSPLTAAIQAGDSYYGGEPQPFWISLILIQALSWLLLLGAGWRLRTAVSREGSGIAAGPQKSESEKGRAVGLTSWQPSKDESNPVEWLVYRQYGIGAGLWGTALLALAYNGWVMLARQPTGPRPGLMGWLMAWPFAVTAGLIGGALVAFVASRFFVGVRRSGDLELLLTTPVGADSIVADQWSVLKRLFAWPVLVMQAPMLPQILSALSALPAAASGVTDSGPILKLLTLLNTFLGAAALCWLGLWFGLKTRTQAGAIVWSVALAKGLPSLITLLGVFAGQMTVSSYGGRGGLLWLFEYVPELLNTLIYLGLIIVARHQLLAALAGAEPLPFTPSGSATMLLEALDKARAHARKLIGWQAAEKSAR
jgi:ABC-type transport system involved in multi-copper enzyme maturation permease subunit